MAHHYTTLDEEFAWITKGEDVDTTYRTGTEEKQGRIGVVIRDDGHLMCVEHDSSTWIGWLQDKDKSDHYIMATPHTTLASVFVQLQHRQLPERAPELQQDKQDSWELACTAFEAGALCDVRTIKEGS